MGPTILYVVAGIPIEGPAVPYPTDPRIYGVDVFREQVSDDEFDREYRHRVHAYQEVEHAAEAMRLSGLEPIGSFLMVFVRIEDQWVCDDDATREALKVVAYLA